MTNTPWPLVALGEVAQFVQRPEVPAAGRVYRQIGVRLWGEGAYEREGIDGGQTRYSTLSRVEADDIVVNKIWARSGSAAVVPPELAGCYGSNEFPTFVPDRKRLEPRWFHWLTKTRPFWEQCDDKSRGTSGKNRIRPERFLEIEIPLPRPDEQRRIVARVEALAARIAEARRLRQEAVELAKTFAGGLHCHVAGDRVVRLDEVLTLDEDREAVQPDSDYPQVGMKAFGGGLFARGAIGAAQTTYKAFNRLYDGAIVLSQVKGWEGAIAVCGPEFAGSYASPEYRTFRCLPHGASPEYLAYIVPTPWFWSRLHDLTRGVGARRERVRPEQFLQMMLPMPTLRRQEQALPVLANVAPVAALQAETAAALDALMPAILGRAFRGEL